MTDLSLNADSIRVKLLSFDNPQFLNTEINNWRITSRVHIWRPYTDVYETEDAYTVRVEIAGMRNADFTLSLEERFLIIRGIRPDVLERRAYHQMEIPFGEFLSEVELPGPVNVDGVEATYQDGFLRIVLPKVRPKHIDIVDE